jgi:hypothetical protein
MFVSPEECLVWFKELLEQEKSSLGIGYVGVGDVQLIPEYPAVLLTSDPLVREQHGTRRFQNFFNLSLWVYHANVSVDRATRTLEDLELVTRIRNRLHKPDAMTMGGNIIHGFVDSESPGVLTGKSNIVIGTRMTWTGRAQQNWG